LCAFAIGDHDGDLSILNSPSGDTLRKGFEIRAASAQQHAYSLFHERKTLAQSITVAKFAQF
jgi:hypothetical protein